MARQISSMGLPEFSVEGEVSTKPSDPICIGVLSFWFGVHYWHQFGRVIKWSPCYYCKHVYCNVIFKNQTTRGMNSLG